MDIDTYCKNPRTYKNLPRDTRKYYDRICSMKQHVSIGWKKEFERLGINLLQAPEKIISGMISPQGLEMLGVFMGIDLTGKLALNAILRGIARGIGQEVMEIAAQHATEQGALFINNAIISSIVASAVEEGTMAATAFAVTEAVSSAVSEVVSVVTIIQFLGMIIDMWDPLGYSNELNADTMDIIAREFDIAFANKFLELLTIGRDRFGRPIHFGQVPVEYRADSELMKTQSQFKLYKYTFEYLDKLEYNSDGHAMYPRLKTGTLLDNNVFLSFTDNIILTLSNKNTVVARWIRLHTFIVIIFIACVVWIVFQ